MYKTIDGIKYFVDSGYCYVTSTVTINGYVIPTAYSSNLLSCPSWYISLEDGATAGLLHDYLYDSKVSGTRWDADMVLYRLLRRKVGFFKAATVWVVVRLVAWVYWKSFTRMP